MVFAQRLKELRKERQLTQYQMAQMLDISMMAYCHYEIGDREPRISTIIALCNFFDVTADYLIGRTDY